MDERTAHFSDYDHENERHVSIHLRNLVVVVHRQLDFNADYAEDVEPPEDWAESEDLQFGSAGELAGFLQAFGDELINHCFSYFPQNSQLDSDEAHEAWAEFVAAISDAPSGLVDRDVIARLVSFPR